jgi:N-acetylglucosaminyl-diphospho-decaprenol L-rhamnosyltransferase
LGGVKARPAPVSSIEAHPRVEAEISPIDVVIVSYRSAATLRGCVEPLAQLPSVHVSVVDNASPDNSLDVIADLPVDAFRAERNGGFSYGCNLGAGRGRAPFILFLNPDARMEPDALGTLVAALQNDPRAGLVAPRIVDEEGSLLWSLRRFPRQSSTFGLALFAHRLWPHSRWSDELVRDPDAYHRHGTPEWVSGACMLVRRSLFEELGGFDEGFFLYCEDTDLCRRIWSSGRTVLFEPAAEVLHVEGSSSGAGETQAILAQSRVRYARKHMSRTGAAAQKAGVALGELTRAAATCSKPALRRGHLAALRAALAQRAV